MSEANNTPETAEVPNTQGAEAQQQGPAGAELTVQDLNAIKAIIDVASQRGAFKPNEMMTVGQTYTKLEQFLTAVGAREAQEQQPQQGA
jgi:hypothetical protein